MTTRPPVTLRPATEADVPFLLALREQTMDAHFRNSGRTPTRDEHLERVYVRFECARVIESQGRPGGLLKVTRDGLAWELIQIQLTPELQGRGVGDELIRNLLDEARAAGASVSLNVLSANPARRLYERRGFRVVGQGDSTYRMQWTG